MLRFSKLQGAGNDFVLLDTLQQPLPTEDRAALARRLCDRRFGVGGDGLVLVEPSESADYRMRIFNADGSEASMCGNGIRCLARYLWQQYALQSDALAIETKAGVRRVYRAENDQITVEMGQPRILDRAPTHLSTLEPLLSAKYDTLPLSVVGVAVVDTGAPHLVLLVQDLEQFPLEAAGAVLEGCHPDFPDRVNVSVAQVERPDFVRARVWERGVGVTLACGTGACAVVVAGVWQGLLERRATVQMPGGTLYVEWREDDRLWLTGEAVWVYEGTWLSP